MRRRRLYVFTFTFFTIVLQCCGDVGVIKLRVPYNTNQEVVVNSTVEYMLEFYQENEELIASPARVRLRSEDATLLQPVLISARHNNGAAMWQLPFVTRSNRDTMVTYSAIERTLCPHNNVMLNQRNDSLSCDGGSQSVTVIHISTTCTTNLRVQAQVEAAEHFYMALDETVTVEVAPNTPSYFFYSFEYGALAARVSLSSVRAAWLEACGRNVTAEQHEAAELVRNDLELQYPPPRVRVVAYSDDDICATVSIQTYTCPVFDSEREILYEGQYMTMTHNSSVTLTRTNYPSGFHIVLIVRESDEECLGESVAESPTLFEVLGWEQTVVKAESNNVSRLKTISFRIEATISYMEYVTATSVATSFFLAFYVIFLIVVLILKTKWALRCLGKDVEASNRGRAVVNDSQAQLPTIAGSSCSLTFLVNSPKLDSVTPSANDNESDSDTPSSSRDNVSRRSVQQSAGTLDVAQLSRHRTRLLIARSQRYLWTVITVAVFYSLPVVQLVIAYQRILNVSGNQDLCYYNFLCANRLGGLADFNHVYSNIGYALLGALFIIQVARRQKRQRYKVDIEGYGLPPQYGLYYSLGFGLIIVGLLSASYHLCPNQMNFQFDTAFMYVVSVLCMVKIYQTRHPDLTARAHSTFGVLAFIIALGVYGVLSNSALFWVVFTVLHVGAFFLLSLQIYYVGKYKKFSELPIVEAARSIRTGGTRVIADAAKPRYLPRLILLLIANALNWVYAGYGLWTQTADFASHILMLLLGNLAVYTIIYIILKLVQREKVLPHSWIFIVLALTAWPAALYFFIDGTSNWATTPALSRTLNSDCILLSFYDAHDIWHFLSAVAMFISFNMLLTWDDGLSLKPRHLISVF